LQAKLLYHILNFSCLDRKQKDKKVSELNGSKHSPNFQVLGFYYDMMSVSISRKPVNWFQRCYARQASPFGIISLYFLNYLRFILLQNFWLLRSAITMQSEDDRMKVVLTQSLLTSHYFPASVAAVKQLEKTSHSLKF
jgi:hypothetical protein